MTRQHEGCIEAQRGGMIATVEKSTICRSGAIN
jgi:hypothetical protein